MQLLRLSVSLPFLLLLLPPSISPSPRSLLHRHTQPRTDSVLKQASILNSEFKEEILMHAQLSTKPMFLPFLALYTEVGIHLRLVVSGFTQAPKFAHLPTLYRVPLEDCNHDAGQNTRQHHVCSTVYPSQALVRQLQ